MKINVNSLTKELIMELFEYNMDCDGNRYLQPKPCSRYALELTEMLIQTLNEIEERELKEGKYVPFMYRK